MNNLKAKVRYRANDYSCKIINKDSSGITVKFDEKQFAIANGQSIVFYKDETCLGGAVIDSSF
jgi:tRNA-specific 2-thiouridylase